LAAGCVLQDGTAALPRDNAGAHFLLNPFRAGINTELGFRRFLQPRQHGAGHHHQCPVGQLDAAPGIKPTALALDHGQMFPTAGAAGQFAPHRAQHIARRLCAFRLFFEMNRWRLGDDDWRRQHARRCDGHGLRVDRALPLLVVAGERQGQDGFDDRPGAHVEGAYAEHETEKEQDMQRRDQHPGRGAQHGLSTLFCRPQGAGSGTQKRVRQGNLVGQS
jgi:hypothetical protein